MTENIYFQTEIGECTEFLDVDLKHKHTVTVIISPLKVYSDDSTVRVNSGCNFWKSCHNQRCQFSEVSHPQSKPV